MRLYNRFLLFFLRVADILLRTDFVKTIGNWKKWSDSTKESVNQIQEHRLTLLLKYATQKVPFYQHPRNSSLKDFPVMTKNIIALNLEELISGDYRKADLIEEKSSGSSGVQGSVFMTRRESLDAIANQSFLWSLSGYQFGDNLLQLGMSPDRGIVKRLKDILFRTDYQLAFNLDEQKVLSVLKKYRGNKSAIFFGGYASGLYEYARIAMKHNIRDIEFKSVISWGDKMFDHYRTLIEEIFNTNVYDTYGCTEGFMIAGQCQHFNCHILTPHVYIELLDANGKEVPYGEMGQVVVTRLDARAMPLIRYYLGDLAIKENPSKECSCGLPYPMLRKIVGRDTDVVKTPLGKSLIIHFFTGIFEHISEIRQFRVLQDSVHKFSIEIISDLEGEFLDILLDEIHKRLELKAEEKLQIFFKQVREIPTTNSGKPQIIVSTLPNEFR